MAPKIKQLMKEMGASDDEIDWMGSDSESEVEFTPDTKQDSKLLSDIGQLVKDLKSGKKSSVATPMNKKEEISATKLPKKTEKQQKHSEENSAKDRKSKATEEKGKPAKKADTTNLKEKNVKKENPRKSPEEVPSKVETPKRSKSDLFVVTPNPAWLNLLEPTPLHLEPLSTSQTAQKLTLHKQAKALLTRENAFFQYGLDPEGYPDHAPTEVTLPDSPPQIPLPRADISHINTLLKTGTMSDKITTHLLLISTSPIHSVRSFEWVLSVAEGSKGGGGSNRDMSLKGMRLLVEWCFATQGQGGLGGRKLKNFLDQPGLPHLIVNLGGIDVKDKDQRLLVWAFEEWLKTWFWKALAVLEKFLHDPITQIRTQSLYHLYNLLNTQAEQEANILRLLVWKLGDRTPSVSSKASHLILQLLQHHPRMTHIIVREISRSVMSAPASGAPATGKHIKFDSEKVQDQKELMGAHHHAHYYALVTLNQVMLDSKDPNVKEIAKLLLDVYFGVFDALVGTFEKERPKEEPKSKKRGRENKQEKKSEEVPESSSKLVGALLTGMNRAFPYTNLADEELQKHLDTLYKIVHTSTFNVCIQALMLIFQLVINPPKRNNKSAESETSDKKEQKSRFYRALYGTLQDSRLQTSSKQALYLNLLLRSLKLDIDKQRITAFVKRLLQLLTTVDGVMVFGGLVVVAELIATTPNLKDRFSKPESSDETYDGKKREPLFSNADNSCIWELMPFVNHYHPIVSSYATAILTGLPLPPSPELEQHTLNHLLDRFAYREAKKTQSNKGSSMMQSGLAGQDRAGRIVFRKGGVKTENDVVTFNTMKDKDALEVDEDQLFFHTYFSFKKKQEEEKTAAAAKNHRKNNDSDDDDESIVDLGFSKKEMADLDDMVDSDDDPMEKEIWKAMKASMPRENGDEDFESDAEKDDDSVAEFHYSDSEEGSDSGEFKSAFPDEESDGDDNILDEDDDDLLDSDADLEMPMFDSEDDQHLGSSGAEEDDPKAKKNKKRKLKHLPLFATAEDYAHLLGDDDGN